MARAHRLITLLGAGVVAACVAPPAPTPTPTRDGFATTAPSGTPAATAAGSPPPAAGDPVWTLAGFGDEASATQVRDVVAMPDGFVAVGSAGQAGEVARAWHSADGETWEPETIAGRGTTPEVLVPWGDQVLALGWGQSDRCAHPGELDTWVRDAGGSWTEAPFDRLFCAGGNLTPVILDGRPWLIGDGTGDVPVLMDSDDGLSWTDHRDRVGDVFLWDAAVDRTGLWIFARSLAGDDWLALRSRDGVRWSSDPVRLAGGGLVDVAAAVTLDGKLVVVASTEQGIVRLTPAAAGGWDEAAVTGLPGPALAAISVENGTLVAFSEREDSGRDLWASADGTSWRAVVVPVEAGSGTTFWDIAVGDDRAVLVGQVPAPGGTAAVGAVWTAPASILAP